MMHDRVIIRKEFQPGHKVLLYNSRLHIFLGKLKSRWIDPSIVHNVHLHGVVEIYNTMDGTTFHVNGHQLKSYREYLSPEVEEILLKDPFYQD